MSNGRAGRTTDHFLMTMAGPPIVRFRPKRVCADCDTVLSIYNPADLCSLHERPRWPPVNRVL